MNNREDKINEILSAAGKEIQDDTFRVVMDLGNEQPRCYENGIEIECLESDFQNATQVTLNF